MVFVSFVLSVSTKVSSSTLSVMRRIVAEDGFTGLFAGRSFLSVITIISTEVSPYHLSLRLFCLCQVSSPGWSKLPQPAPSWSAVTSLEKPFSENTTRKRTSGHCKPPTLRSYIYPKQTRWQIQLEYTCKKKASSAKSKMQQNKNLQYIENYG